MKKVIFLILVVAIGGYLYFGLPLPSSHSNDQRVAYVFAREGLGSAPCIHVDDESREDLLIPKSPDDDGPPQLTQNYFDSEEIGLISSELASGDFEIVRPRVTGMRVVSGESDETCFSSIGPILVVDDIAIVHFMSPGGPIGSYVFKREFFGWRAIERVGWAVW